MLSVPPAIAQTETAESWLSDTTNWNKPGAAIPPAPAVEEGGNLPNCAISLRQPTLPEDQLLQDAGWALTGPAQVYGDTTVITGMANADGMCRPLSYQTFVFTNGNFVGTLSPLLMDSRSDGSLGRVNLYRDGSLDATFNRYTPEDPLCCPSSSSRIFYEVKEENGKSVLVPQLPAETTPNS